MQDWNQHRGDRRHSGKRREAVGPATRPEREWTAELRGTVGAPAIDRETVFVGTDEGNVYAIESWTGRTHWVFETTADTHLTPAVTAETCYVACTDGTVYALDAETGEQQWSQTVTAPLETPPARFDGRLYVGGGLGVTAFDVATGEELWHHDTGCTVTGAPAVDNAHVYVGARNGTVLALERETGEEVWEVPTNGVLVDAPTLVDDRLYVADDDGLLLALNTETGQSWFTYEIRGAFTGAPTVCADSVFVPATDGYLHVTDTIFGRRKVRGLLFSKKGISLDGIPHTTGALAGDVLCVGDSSDALYGISVEKTDFIWHLPLEQSVSGTPALEAGRLVTGTTEGTLFSFTWDDS